MAAGLFARLSARLLAPLLGLTLLGCPQAAPDASEFADTSAGVDVVGGALDGQALDTNAGSDAGATDVGDGASADTAIPDGGVPDTATPDTATPDTNGPDTNGPDTSGPDTTDPDAKDPGKPTCTLDKDCDDGDPCTANQCDAGSCSALAQTDWTSCGVGKQCVGKLGCVATVRGSTAAIAVGQDTSCAITTDHVAWCWGRNDKAQIALGNTTGGPKGVLWPTVTLLGKVLDIAISWGFGCAVTDAGTLRCWGSNSHGQLGVGPGAPKLIATPTDVKTTEKFAHVSLGVSHACALRGDGAVFCWGIGAAGQLGDGKGAGSDVPVQAIGVSQVEKLAMGEAFTCARDMNGDVFCFGTNGSGQLGDGLGGTSKSSYKPVKPLLPNSFVADIAAGRDHVCALVSGDVWCWGANQAGQLGNGSIGSSKNTPAKVFGLSFKPDALALGGDTSCAYQLGGKLACWGSNAYGQIMAPASSTAVKGPVEITGLVGLADLVAAEKHLCARIFGQQVACWGDNYSGQLGAGPGITKSAVPLIVGQPAP